MLVSSSRSMWINNIIDHIKLPFRKEKELFSSLYEILGFYPHHIEYYRQALMHKSIGRRNDKGKPLNNERLEFLGDAILDAIVGHIVYSQYEGKREGFLTNTRSKLVSRETLGKLANEMGLSQLLLSAGRSNSHNSYVNGNAFEALVGAIYLEKGYRRTRKILVDRVLRTYVDVENLASADWNFKSKLIDWGQKNHKKVTFEIVRSVVRGHSGRREYECRVDIDGQPQQSDIEYTIKAAEQLAAEKTYKALEQAGNMMGEASE